MFVFKMISASEPPLLLPRNVTQLQFCSFVYHLYADDFEVYVPKTLFPKLQFQILYQLGSSQENRNWAKNFKERKYDTENWFLRC